MQRRSIDPWGWDQHAVTPINEVSGAARTVYFSGFPAQVRLEDPEPVAGDVRGQLAAAMDNVEAALAEVDMTLANVVRLNIFTTDIDAVMADYEVLGERLRRPGVKVAGCLIGVARLALPSHMVEIEATAVA